MKTFISREKFAGAVKIEGNGVCRIVEIHRFKDIKHASVVEVFLGRIWDLDPSFLALAFAEEHPENCADRFLYSLITGCSHYYGV